MNIYQKELPNKLRNLVIHDTNSDTATILILVRTGARYEHASNAGVAHFIEHTIFKGTEKRPKTREIAMEIETLGAKMNAFTSYEYTGYHIKIPQEKFEEAFEILSDMFQNSLFDSKEIEKERGVIIEEKNMYEDQPMDKVDELFTSNLFAGHDLSREIIGSYESIRNMQRQDFLTFIEEHYKAQNVLITIAGGVEKQRAFDTINKYFSEYHQGETPRMTKYTPKQPENRIVHQKKDIAQSHLMLGTFGLSRHDSDRYTFKVANAILGKGFGSRLFQVIRDELGLAYYVYAQIQEFEEVGALKIGLGVENSKIQSAVDAVRKELNEIVSGKFDENEIIRAQNYLIGNLTTGLESSDELAAWYGLQELLLGRIYSVDEVKQKILSVTKEGISEVFGGIVRKDNISLAGVTPHDDINVKI